MPASRECEKDSFNSAAYMKVFGASIALSVSLFISKNNFALVRDTKFFIIFPLVSLYRDEHLWPR